MNGSPYLIALCALAAAVGLISITASLANPARKVEKPAARWISLSKLARTISYLIVKAKKSTRDADYSYCYPKFSGIPASIVAVLNKVVTKVISENQPDAKEERGNPQLRNSHDVSVRVC